MKLIRSICVLTIIMSAFFMYNSNAETAKQWIIEKEGGTLVGDPPHSYVGYNRVVQHNEFKTLTCTDPGAEKCEFMTVPEGISYTNHINHMIQYAENQIDNEAELTGSYTENFQNSDDGTYYYCWVTWNAVSSFDVNINVFTIVAPNPLN